MSKNEEELLFLKNFFENASLSFEEQNEEDGIDDYNNQQLANSLNNKTNGVSEERERRQRILQELWELDKEIDWENQPSPDEIVEQIKQIRKEMAEEKAKGWQK